MTFCEISLEVFRNLIDLLMKCFCNTSSHHDAGDEDRTTRASSSSTPPNQKFEVFLSFSGKDTRHGFTDHLYHGLKNRGIEVFRDNEDLHVGEKIDQLFEYIEASKISIPIISLNYASSIWCLKELLKILECKNISGQLVLPIFYHVKPSDVREQKGIFGKNFQLCKKKHNLDGGSLANAFIEIANIKVWEVNETAYRYEGELVNEVVSSIFNQLRKAVLVVPDFLVGVEDHVKKIKKMIDEKPSRDAKIIAIHGMGGIGKTTLAKVLYNALCDDFECRSFVPNIREASKNYKGMEALQKQIISDILDYKSPREISHVDEGIKTIENSFKGKRLMLLLDDVENNDQLNKLVTEKSLLESKSIVIITTRNKDLTKASVVNLSYKLDELNMHQSYELFCKHAFRRDASCPRDLETLAKHIVSTTGGLPLAVEVIGSFLKQQNKDFWKEALEKLRNVPNKKVQDKLKISYDYLEDTQKQIFLDIACLPFTYEIKMGYVACMWESCGFYPIEGVDRLMSLSLIKWDDRLDTITMHDQLRDLGRAIVHEEGRENIGLCSRIWSKDEATEVLERKQGTPKVQALILPTFEKLHYKSEDFEGMPNLRFLRMGNVHLTGDFENLFTKLRWLQWEYVGDSCVDIMEINLNPKKLAVLDLFGSNVTDHWKGWSYMKDLKVLSLRKCMNITTTPDFSALKELKVLYLFNCQGLKKIHPSIGKFSKTLKVFCVIDCRVLDELPIEFGKMEELKQIEISFSSSIREIPIFEGYMTKLERLVAGYCSSLHYIPDSLGSLVKLQCLHLYMCKSVTKIPESIGKLRSLTELNLAGTGIEELPDSIGELCNLESLRMQETPIKCLPTSIGMLSKLRELNLERCKELKSLPSLPSSLTSLSFNGDSMETLPDFSNLTNLKSLTYTDLFERRNRALNLGDLNQLQTLEIRDTDQFSDLAEELDTGPEKFRLQLELPVSLLKLEVSDCQTLHALPNFSNFENLSKLSLELCSELMGINGLGGAKSLTDLMIRGCRKLSRVGDLSHLKRLRKIELSDCEKLRDVQGIEKLISLTSLKFSQSHPKIKFPDLSMLTNLKDLMVEDKELMEIPGFQGLKSLECLDISGCKSLQHLPDLSKCTKLKKLVVKGCEKLIEIQGLKISAEEFKISECSELIEINGLGGAELLKDLEIKRCRKLSRLGDLSHLKMLKKINLHDCENLSDVQGIEESTSLTQLSFSRCHPRTKFPDLSMLTNLQDLSIDDKELMEIPGLQELKSLESLNITGCKSLQHLPDLSQCTKLKCLVVYGCEKLSEIRGGENLASLKEFGIRGCMFDYSESPNVRIKIFST